MLNILINACIIAVAAVVWIQMLVRPGEALDFIPAFLNKWTGKVPKLHKVLFQCEKCFAGQLSLWGYFFIYPGWNPFTHFLLIVLSIFTARVAGGLIAKHLG